MADESGFELGGAKPVTAHFDNIIDAADDPIITIFVPPGGITGEMVGYMLATARRPQPLLALGAKRADWRDQGLLAISVDDERLSWPSARSSASSARSCTAPGPGERP